MRLPFPVNETDREIDVILHSPAPFLIDFAVEAPDGQVFGPAVAAGPGAQFVNGRGTAFYRLTLPTPIVGPQDPTRPWHGLLRLDRKRWDDWVKRHEGPVGVPGVSVHGVRYAFTTQARSTLRMDVAVTQSSREPGATAWLRATLTEYGFSLASRADVVVSVRRPDGWTFDLPLTRGAGAVFDGSFPVTASGAWRLTFRANGETSRGAPFTREALRSVAVWPGGDDPGPTPPPRDTVGDLLDCICRGKVLDPERAKEWGLDLEALCKCLHRPAKR